MTRASSTTTLASYADRTDWTRGQRNILTDRPMPEVCDDAPVWEYATRYANRESLCGHGYAPGILSAYVADRR